MTSTPKAATPSPISLPSNWQSFINSRGKLLSSKLPPGYQIPGQTINLFPWLEKLRSTRALDYVLFFSYTNNPDDFPGSGDDSITEYMALERKILEIEAKLARATCQPILSRVNSTDIESPPFTLEKHGRCKTMVQIRSFEKELLDLAIRRNTLESKVLSGQLTATADRYKAAIKDLDRMHKYPMQARTPSPYEGPVIPQNQATLFFLNAFQPSETDSVIPSHISETSSPHSSRPPTIFTTNDQPSISSAFRTSSSSREMSGSRWT